MKRTELHFYSPHTPSWSTPVPATSCGIYRRARPGSPDTSNLHTLTQIYFCLQYHGRGNSSRSDAHTRRQQRRSVVPGDQNIRCDRRDKQEPVNQLTRCESQPCAPPNPQLTATLHMTSRLRTRSGSPLGRTDKPRDTCTHTYRFSAQYELIVGVL